MVRAAQDGDDEAFRTLYRNVQPGLLRYLTALVGEEAEDVASETWLQVIRALPTFEGPSFRAWVVRVARNRAMDHLRRLRRQPSQSVPVELLRGIPSDAAEIAEQASESIGTEAAVALIAALPPREAEAVLLRAVLGLDAESAGYVLGRSPGAVRTAAHRGLRRLAGLLPPRNTPVSPTQAGPPAQRQPVQAPDPTAAQLRVSAG